MVETLVGTKRLLRSLGGEAQGRPPFWLMRQAGRYLPEYRQVRAQVPSFLDMCYTPELAVEVTLQPIRRFSPDAAIIFSDILVVADGLGQRVDFVEGEGPVLEPVRTASDLARLDATRVPDKLTPVYEAVARVAGELSDDTALIGFAGAPWTVACYMVEGGGSRDFSAIKRWAYTDPDGFQELIDLLVEVTAAHLSAQVAAGADVVQLFESWAGILAAPAFERWCVAPLKAITARVKAACPGVPVIAFPRGAGALSQGYARATGVDAVGLDTTVPTRWAAEVLQKDSAVQGNLDPQVLVVGGEAMAAEAERIIADLNHGPFVFNLGHGVVPETPPEHVEQLAALIRGR